MVGQAFLPALGRQECLPHRQLGTVMVRRAFLPVFGRQECLPHLST